MPTDIDYERYKAIDLDNTVGIKLIKPPIVLRLQEIMRNLATQNAFSQIENPAEWQRELSQDKTRLYQDNLMNLDNRKLHEPDGNNVYGIIYTTEIDESLLKVIAKAFNISEQEIRLKISNFDNAKSLIYCTDNLEFILYKDGKECLFNSRVTGTERQIYQLLTQLAVFLAQKNIKSCFEFYDENHNLIFEIS